MVIRLFFLLFILFSFSKAEDPKEVKTPLYVENLKDEAQFRALGGDPLTNKYNEVISVKVVYDLQLKKMFYINSNDFQFHFEFCQRYLDPDVYLSKFNADNYSENMRFRKFLLGNINYFSDLDVYALELSPSDYMQVGYIEKLQTEIVESSFIGEDQLKIMLNNQRLNDLKPLFDPKFSFLTPEDIYKNMKSQSVVEGESVGRLRFVEDFDAESSSFQQSDIIVIRETPLILPKVNGVIVAQFQTPLSHLSILGKNRKMPVVAVKSAFENKKLLDLKDANVLLKITKTGYTIENSERPTNALVSERNGIKLKFDLEIDSLIGVEHLNRKSEMYAGNKARNFGWLYDLSKKRDFKTPEKAFAIPFHFYDKHVSGSPAAGMIQSLLKNDEIYSESEKLKVHLKQIRKAIKTKPLDPDFLRRVEDRIETSPKYKRMRFRSSTNAEDAKGFSGAGLYASKTGEIGVLDKTVEKAIKKVWASLWSYGAYMEREYFGIDHSTVQMGILVHRSFPNEEVNGVIISKNLYRSHYPGFVVNAQLGDESVVKPKPGVDCDQFICYAQNSTNVQPNETVIDVITYSSLNDRKPVMTEEEIQLLANEVDDIKLQVYRRIGRRFLYEDFGLDLEFKLDANTRQLYIKQFRLYND